MGEGQRTHKIIVGVDFGTTYSGVSYVSTAKEGINDTNDISLIRDWPGPCRESDEVSKTPSRIAFAFENDKWKLDSNRWGYQVEPKHKSYSWLKLGLDTDVRLTDYDDPEISSMEVSQGTGMFKLPIDMDATTTCTAYLEPLYQHTMTHLEKRFSEEGMTITPIEFWFTVPAIWSDKAKASTKLAASRAGFGSRQCDKIFMITEPEAAAVAALKSLSRGELGQDQLVPDTGILICDCGGGTVDITTYRIKETKPKLNFEELIEGMGGKCGSTYIDRKFHSWLAEVFGQEFKELSFDKKGPGSRLMREFELIKRDFGAIHDPNQEFEVTLVMKAKDSMNYDKDESLVKFSYGDMVGFFEGAMNRIIRLVDDQIRKAASEAPNCPVKLIILVGGFGDSPYLNWKLRAWCQKDGRIRLLCPDKPQAAIVRGAALRGLEGIKPSSRRSRRHYGFELGRPFREGIDPEESAYTEKWTGKKHCGDLIRWQVKKGQYIDENTTLISDIFLAWNERNYSRYVTVTLYQCDGESAPDRLNDPRVEKIGQVVSDLQKLNSRDFERKSVKGKKVWRIDYHIEAKLGNEEGVLCFRTICNGKEYGNTEINYTD